MLGSFRLKLILVFTVLITVGHSIIFYAVFNAITQNVIKQTQENLIENTINNFISHLNNTARYNLQSIAFLGRDKSFQQALQNQDILNTQNMINDLQKRTHANQVILFTQQQIIASASPTKDNFNLQVFNELIRKAEKGYAIDIIPIRDAYTNYVMIPINNANTPTWLAIGIEIDNQLLHKLIGNVEQGISISLFTKNDQAQDEIIASTLDENTKNNLLQIFHSNPEFYEAKKITINHEKYIVNNSALSTALFKSNIKLIAAFPHKKAMQPYNELLNKLLFLFVIGFFVTIIAALLLSRKITQPVRELAETAKRIEDGNYFTPIPKLQNDELGRLGKAMNHMMKALHDRELKIAHQSHHDALTDLPNRLMFEEELNLTLFNAKENKATFTVLLMGIDRFKQISNTLGHKVADQLIQQVGERLCTVIKDTDNIARLTSDEFVLLMPNTTTEQGEFIAQRLINIFDNHFIVEGSIVDVSIQIGITCYPFHGTDAQTLIQRAEIAQFHNKKSNTRIRIYDKTLDPIQASHLSLMSELRNGLENNDFQLHYQPKIDLALNKITHVEALIRWQHPEKGLLLPDEFIPLAEQTGNIIKVTEWAIDAACKQAYLWQQNNTTLKIAVNLSTKDLTNQKFPQFMKDKVKEHHMESQYFVLEITESSVMQDPDSALQVMRALNDMGFMLSIDDFGTGYSSMSYLKRLPVAELKIDKSFVLQLANNKEDEIIVRSTIELGHNLGLKVTAEGVEDEQSLNILKRYHCDQAQGHYFSKALPADELIQWVKSSAWH